MPNLLDTKKHDKNKGAKYLKDYFKQNSRSISFFLLLFLLTGAVLTVTRTGSVHLHLTWEVSLVCSVLSGAGPGAQLTVLVLIGRLPVSRAYRGCRQSALLDVHP